MNKRLRIFGWLLAVVIVIATALIVLNRQWLKDFWHGMSYQPSAAMADIRSKLNLTDQGTFLFNASQPELNTSESFNSYCRTDGQEIAVLGCYTGDRIYIYDINTSELKGIRELTTAHELLHAVFARMSSSDKESLRQDLDKTYQANQDILKSDLDTYDETERYEELYVRAGTEVKKLPDSLEKHYATIFKDQDQIVDYYNSYISVFRALEAELDALATEMDALSNEITAKTAEYKERVTNLNNNITEFNNCAASTECYMSQYEFYSRRNTLVAEQNNLEFLYNEISALIDTYNVKVEAYNADVLQTQKLNKIINSAPAVTEEL
ncbi:hypothetical protein IKF67_02595 [Candidatus Saccharibacteria bacterium]|nr:hypothetical protein [Candidatus Saccharibacteria bacterium]